MRSYNLSIIALLLALLPGCGEIADVQPFATATSNMGDAIDASLQQVRSDVEQADKVFKPNIKQKSIWDDDKLLIEKGSKNFKKVAHQFDEYAKVMVQVAEVGKKRDESITKAFKVTQDLIEASKDYLSPLGAPFVKPLETATTQIGAIIKSINDKKTNGELEVLASPEQEQRIQDVAKALKKGLAAYDSIDAVMFDLIMNNDNRHDLFSRYSNAVQHRQDYAIQCLEEMVEAERWVMQHPKQDGNLGDKDGILDRIDKLNADPTRTIHQTFDKFKYGTPKSNTHKNGLPKHSPAAHAALLAALREREHYYNKLIDDQLPPALQEAEKTRWNTLVIIPQEKSQALFAKSQRLIGTWATSHHDLREALLKSGRVTRQDLVAQAQDIQKLISELQDAKEASAKAAKEAADKAAKEAAKPASEVAAS
jgi:hypothetical protein